MFSKLDLDSKCQGHSRNHKLMIWGTKTSHPKKNASQDADSLAGRWPKFSQL